VRGDDGFDDDDGRAESTGGGMSASKEDEEEAGRVVGMGGGTRCDLLQSAWSRSWAAELIPVAIVSYYKHKLHNTIQHDMTGKREREEEIKRKEKKKKRRHLFFGASSSPSSHPPRINSVRDSRWRHHHQPP
jgi:hypothetical protein